MPLLIPFFHHMTARWRTERWLSALRLQLDSAQDREEAALVAAGGEGLLRANRPVQSERRPRALAGLGGIFELADVSEFCELVRLSRGGARRYHGREHDRPSVGTFTSCDRTRTG